MLLKRWIYKEINSGEIQFETYMLRVEFEKLVDIDKDVEMKDTMILTWKSIINLQ